MFAKVTLELAWSLCRPTELCGFIETCKDSKLNLETMLSLLDDVSGPDPKGWYTAICPFHPDHHPSLRLTEYRFLCMACGEKGNLRKLAAKLGIIDGGNRASRKIVATYDYLDKNGRLLYQVVKRSPKGFSQRRPDGKGKWIWNRKGVPRVLYRLPELLAAPNDATVFIAEGEKDVEALRSLNVVATCNPEGVGKFTTDFREPFQGRIVVVIPDKDEPGIRHARQVAETLRGVASRIKVMELPGDEVNDPADWVAAGGTRKQLLELVDAAPDWDFGAYADPEQSPVSGLPEIVVTDRHMRDIASDSWEVLVAVNDPPFVFQRGHLISDIILDDKGQPMLRAYSRVILKGLLGRIANFMRMGETGKKPARPPSDVVADMLEEKDLPLPLLLGISESPLFTPSGVLATEPGYQRESCYFLKLPSGIRLPEVSSYPDEAAITRARNPLVYELLGDFPFVGQPDLANAVAVLLLPFVRLMVDGPTPLHIVESPTPGTGKGLFVMVLVIPSAGSGPSVMMEGRDEDEWRKRITARLIQAPACILIDNVRSRLDSAALSAALTSETWEDRILGHSRTVALPVNCTWLATANNPCLLLEMARRTVSFRLDNGVEKPWKRSGFRHPKLSRWAKENRWELIWVALTLSQAWVAAGKPPGDQVLGSYESYAEVRGGILDVAGIPGFLANRDRVYNEAEQEVSGSAEFCQVWWTEYQDSPIATNQLFSLASGHQLLTEIWGGKDQHAARTTFGRAVARMRDRVIGPYQIRRSSDDSHNRVARYHLELVKGGGETAGFAGVFPRKKILIPEVLRRLAMDFPLVRGL